jgi:uncharacterized LabA/DUF88 family protein
MRELRNNNMFNAKTERIEKLSKLFPRRIKELDNIFIGAVNIYIDYGNVFRWQEKLKWHIDAKRLKQLLDSFSSINEIKFYDGMVEGDEKSEQWIKDLLFYGYCVKTKPVKIMSISIDTSSIKKNSPALLENFIKKSLLRKLDLETVEFLNSKLAELNNKGVLHIEDRKCNFDVEIGRDMLLDYERNNIDTYILWSGDSDFADPVEQLIKDGKRVFIFNISGRIASELAKTGAPVFDIRKIKEFICWPKELSQDVKNKINSL